MASDVKSVGELEYSAEICAALRAHLDRVKLYAIYERYYNGQHGMKFASSEFTKKFGATFQSFADNLCRKVVNTFKARTILESIEVGEGSDAEDLFRSQRIDGLQRLIHKDAYLYGDAYLIAWKDAEGKIKLIRNKPALICPIYDENSPGEMLCAVKLWLVTEKPGSKKTVLRMTVYYKNRCERYITNRDKLPDDLARFALTPFDTDGEKDVQAHTFDKVPVFHYANMAGPGEFGTSAIDDVVPLQDALNKSCFDLFVNSEATSLAQRFATGIDVQNGPDGKPVNPFEGKQLWVTGNPDAQFGQLSAGDSEKLLAVVRDWRQEIGLVSGVPSYYLQNDASIPSGTALMVIEAPLRDLIEEAQTLFGNTWEDVFSLALGSQIEDCSAIWRDTSPIGMGERLENGIKKRVLGWSQKQNQRELGLTDDQIKAMEKEHMEEEERAIAVAQRSMTRDSEEE